MPDQIRPSADARLPPIPLAEPSAGRYGLPRRTQGGLRRFPAAMRAILLGMGAALLVGLGIARSLTPDPSGFGTHRQLGLPPCTFVELFGKTCPSCGMTTAWSHVTRGQIRQASAANLGGTLLAITAMIAAPWLILSSASGRWLIVRPNEMRLIVFAVVVAAVILWDWWLFSR